MTRKSHYSKTHRGRSVRLLFVLYVLTSLTGRLYAQNETKNTFAPLRAQLDAVLDVPQAAKLDWGACVVELPSGRVLYDRAGNEPLVPASNMKTIVMAAAIEQLGPDYQFTTVLAVRGTDLVVIGSGDPTFGDEKIAQARAESMTAVFHDWASALKKKGIKQIPGNIVVDDSIFDRKFTHENWPPNQYQNWYEAPVGGLNFNSNCVDAAVEPGAPGQPAKVKMVPGNTYLKRVNNTVTGTKHTVVVSRPWGSSNLSFSGTVARSARVGTVTVPDPGLYFGSVLKTVLATDGIKVGGNVVRGKVRLPNGLLPKDCHPIAVHRSPLSDALARCGKDSLGMMAECLMKRLGAEQSGVGSWESGQSAIYAFMRKLGIPADQVTIDDGSGLSRAGRISPAAMTQVLRYIFNAGPAKLEMMKNALSLAGIDGTLRKRLRSDDTRGRIYGKTGTINGVRTLAGFIHTESDKWLAFAFFYNYSGKMPSPKSNMDRACTLLVHWSDTDANVQKTREVSGVPAK